MGCTCTWNKNPYYPEIVLLNPECGLHSLRKDSVTKIPYLTPQETLQLLADWGAFGPFDNEKWRDVDIDAIPADEFDRKYPWFDAAASEVNSVTGLLTQLTELALVPRK